MQFFFLECCPLTFLTSQNDYLPGMEVRLLPHQLIGVVWSAFAFFIYFVGKTLIWAIM
jgi:hypothetical protein